MDCYGECWERTSTHEECGSVFLERLRAKRFREEAEKRKAGRDTRPKEARIAGQGILGTSKVFVETVFVLPE